MGGDEDDAGRAKKRPNLSLSLNFQNNATETTAALKTLRTPDIQQYLNVPWEMPKLKKRLQHRRKFCFSGQTSSPELSPQKTATTATAATQFPRSPDVELILRSDLVVVEAWNLNNNNNNDNVNNENVNKENVSTTMVTSLMSTSDDYSAASGKESTPCRAEDRPQLPPGGPRSVRKALATTSGGRHSGLQLSMMMMAGGLEGGSDSGISMSSQELKEELMDDVPWSMPKHKRRTTTTTAISSSNNSWISRPARETATEPLSLQLTLDNVADTLGGDNMALKQDVAAAETDRSSEPAVGSEADLSPLPFAMPKLERRLRVANDSSSSSLDRPLDMTRPSSLIRPSSLLRPSENSGPPAGSESPVKKGSKQCCKSQM